MKYQTFGKFIDRCESPIERFFLASLLFFGDYTFEPFDSAPIIARDSTGLELGMQVPCGSYRIDFTLTMPLRSPRLAIELDGHAFHGSTPAQFERDAVRQRALTAAGWTVLRFSGRELVREPRRCAESAMAAAAAAVDASTDSTVVLTRDRLLERIRKAKEANDAATFDALLLQLGKLG